MRLRIAEAAAILLLISPGAALAAFTFEKVLEDEEHAVFFVSYQRGKATRGGLLDTEKNARRKLEKRSEELCAEQGYSYLKFPSLAEIALDQELRAIWEVAVGDQEKNSTATSGNVWSGTVTAHKSRDLLLLSRKPKSGWQRCGSGPASAPSPTSATPSSPPSLAVKASSDPKEASLAVPLTVKTNTQRIREDVWLISASVEILDGQRVPADRVFETAVAEVCRKMSQSSYRRLSPVDIAQDDAVRAVWSVLGAAYGQPVEKEIAPGTVEATLHEIVEFGDSNVGEPCPGVGDGEPG